MKSLNVLILNHNVEWRGTFQRCFDFAKLLTSKNHAVTIITNSPKARFRFEEYKFDGIKIVRTPDLFWGILRSGWDPVNVLRRYWHLKNTRFDIIHAFDNRPTVILPALRLKQKLNCPLVSDWCDWWGRGGAITLRRNKILNFLFAPIETYFEEHFRKHADFLTVISNPLKERAIGLGISKEKIEVIPPLVDTNRIYPVDRKEARTHLGLTQYSPILIFSGFVLYDIEMVLNAFRIVSKQYPNSLLILTGGVKDSIVKSFSDLPILNVGFVSQEMLRNYLGASDLCLLPLSDCLTNRARYPHKIGHYLASGRPVISSPIGEAGRLIEQHQVGVLTEPEVSAFAHGICSALNRSKDLLEMGSRARQVAENYLSGEPFSQKLEQIYYSCLSNHSA